MKKENFNVGKFCQNSEKTIERRLNKKLNNLIEMLVKKQTNKKHQ